MAKHSTSRADDVNVQVVSRHSGVNRQRAEGETSGDVRPSTNSLVECGTYMLKIWWARRKDVISGLVVYAFPDDH